jgi:hypothetical protein
LLFFSLFLKQGERGAPYNRGRRKTRRSIQWRKKKKNREQGQEHREVQGAVYIYRR